MFARKPTTVIAVPVIAMLLLGSMQLAHAAHVNWAKLVTASAWLNVPVPEATTYLRDGIPDGWQASNWGQALAEFGIDETSASSGVSSAYIDKHTYDDYSVYSQAFEAPPDNTILCRLAHKGGAGFVQVRAEGVSGQTDTPLPSSDTWQTATWTFATSPASNLVNLNIGVGAGTEDKLWIDAVACIATQGNIQLPISNDDFEEDGATADFDYGEWWNVARSASDGKREKLLHAYAILLPEKDYNGLNAIDMLLGRAERVAQRMQGMQVGCPETKAKPNFLFGLSRHRSDLSEVQKEYLGRLSVELMPACPQSYQFLSELYRSNHAFPQAARFIHEAITRLPEVPLRGLYYFEEGELYSQYIGHYFYAFLALRQAQKYSGWEPSPWHFGAVQVYLGESLMHLGLCAQARSAFEEVLNCPRCLQQQAQAQAGLDKLARCQEGP